MTGQEVSSATDGTHLHQQPLQSRGKRSRACDSCRRRRSKCVMNQHDRKCFLCTFHDFECSFINPPPKKRRSSRRLSDNAALQTSDANSGEIYPQTNGDSVSPPQGVRNRHPSVPIGEPFNGFEYNISELNVLGNDVMPIGHAPFTESPQIASQKDVTAYYSYVGSTSEWDPNFVKLAADPKSQRGLPLITIGSETLVERQFRRISSSNGFVGVGPGHNNQTFGLENSEIDSINQIVGNNGLQLVSLYFRIVHPSFPIIDKETFLSQFHTNLESVPCSLLACLYLFALNWWSFDSDLSSKPQPSQQSLEKIAEERLLREMDFPTLSTVQAGLLLIQHQSFRDQYAVPGHSWIMQSQMVAISQQLGLDQDCSDWNISLNEKRLRRRLAWGLYIQEKWLSMTMGRTSHIQDINWDVSELTQEDFGEEFPDLEQTRHKDGTIDSETGKELFIQMSKLTQILSCIVDQLYSKKAKSTVRSAGRNGIKSQLIKQLELIRPLQERLREWESNIPNCLQLETVKRGHIYATPNLKISLVATNFSLLKPALSFLGQVKIEQIPVDEEFMRIRKILYERAYHDFESTVEFLSTMRAEHLQTFWYCWAKNGFALSVSFGFLLRLSTGCDTEFLNCTDKIEEYGWKLRVNSKTAEFLHPSRLWLDQLKRLLHENISTPTYKPYSYENETPVDVGFGREHRTLQGLEGGFESFIEISR